MSEFVGAPVKGEISHYSSRVKQKDPKDLFIAIKAMIDDPEVAEFGWRQYTPYFNDGEACEFGVGEPWARRVDQEPEGDEDSYYYERYESFTIYEWTSTAFAHENTLPAHWYTFAREVGDEANENILSDTFGDPAEVTFKDGAFEVEFFDHD